MTAYHVDIDILTSATPDPEVCARIEEGFLRDVDAAVGGSVHDHRATSFSLATDADSATDAEHAAIQAVLGALRYAYVEAGEILSVHVIRWDLFETDLNTPNYPDIVSAVEAADMLGITRQRVHQLWRDRKDFPEPLYELRTGPLWMRAGIKAFADRWERKPGRPDHGARMRERVTSALLDAGLTVADARVFLGHERTVILQIDSPGPLQARRKVAARVIQALNSAGLGVTDEASHSAADMESYLADGHTAEIFEVTERGIAAGLYLGEPATADQALPSGWPVAAAHRGYSKCPTGTSPTRARSLTIEATYEQLCVSYVPCPCRADEGISGHTIVRCTTNGCRSAWCRPRHYPPGAAPSGVTSVPGRGPA